MWLNETSLFYILPVTTIWNPSIDKSAFAGAVPLPHHTPSDTERVFSTCALGNSQVPAVDPAAACKQTPASPGHSPGTLGTLSQPVTTDEKAFVEVQVLSREVLEYHWRKKISLDTLERMKGQFNFICITPFQGNTAQC